MLNRFKEYISSFKNNYLADPIFHNNEKQANKMMVVVLIISGILLITVWLGSEVGIFQFARDIVDSAVIQGLVEIVLLWAAAHAVKEDAWWLKYLLLIGSVFVYSRIDMIFTHKAALIMVIPTICSCRYFSHRLTLWMAALSSATFALSATYGATYGLLNLNDLTLPIGTTMTTTGKFIDSAVEAVGYDPALYTQNTLVFSYLPKWLLFTLVAVISTIIAKWGREMVLTQKSMAEKEAHALTELSLARRIQAGALPSQFPAFPDREDIDIYATMTPAREVGGDFYDFFLIDHDHLGLVIADVSGKGVPAALFMMESKIIIRNNTMAGMSPGQVLEAVNHQICNNNQEDMFVTVWLGILDLRTGLLTASNAGHEYPAVQHAGGSFELFKDRHSFVIGGLEDVRYHEYEMHLEPGSRLFLYTDGIPEASDFQHTLFGTDRMLAALNREPSASPRTILENVETRIRQFVAREEQFDDMTMLCLEYRG